MQEFYFNGDFIIKIEHKMPFFTIKTYKQDRIGNITNIYLTFKLIGDRFYLHQYSKEFGRVDDDKEIIDSTQIYYRQPRDDPKKENLIPLDSINDELLQRLENANVIH